MTHAHTGTILDKILARTTADVGARKTTRNRDRLETLAAERPHTLSLHSSLSQPGMSVIAEIKRASPSRGVFPIEVDPMVVAEEYIAGGAAAISVLTDEPFFQGSLSDMDNAAKVAHGAARPVPILRKDFVVDSYQIVEARAFGADAVLLIVAALSDAALTELFCAAREWQMDALVEVHNDEEMRRAVAMGATIIGVNNRDLKTFSVDLATTERLAPLAPPDAVVVAESGVFGPAEMQRLAQAGAHAVLVGEGLITLADRAAAVRSLLVGSPQ